MREVHTTQQIAGDHARFVKKSVTDQSYADLGQKQKTIPTEPTQQRKQGRRRTEKTKKIKKKQR